MAEAAGTPSAFAVVAAQSALLVEARSNVGPISFGTTTLSGCLRAVVGDRGLRVDPVPRAELTIGMEALTSGNQLYDAELARRIDARRFPTSRLALHRIAEVEASRRYQVTGELTLHGITRTLAGAVTVSVPDTDQLVVEGEHALDIRDFDIPAPTLLLLRIFPEVRVRLHLCLTRTAVDHQLRAEP